MLNQILSGLVGMFLGLAFASILAGLTAKVGMGFPILCALLCIYLALVCLLFIQ
jgi:hypothetical protein